MQDMEGAMEAANDYCSATKSDFGEMSQEYAEALYLKSKAQFNDPGTMLGQAMATCKKCLHIWKNTPLTGGPKDLQHALALLLKATFYMKKGENREAIKVFRKAAYMVSEINGTRLNTETLLQNITQECEKAISAYEQKTGSEFNIDAAMSDEEDADIVQDNKLSMQLLMVSNSITMANSASIIKTISSSRRQQAS
eukprot:CAMPEP_0185599486 /NCGR_PEP_ID=MMETSP0434-20130131/82736_1 /TAXON_ID=626734 ORGANISM="Favella taraikaensis, Strain Fe Narragansett Bay" /NCGR_SAMPLE_ID=MMETSP0434 /ASSEMBLY_ACC=CAM_ASM_000379 /LENGTH=195 /DNA_ID=CAMNT_0028228901 /DNA_START=1337 /DNA_END=1920 /DNA_ORIENTATION=-